MPLRDHFRPPLSNRASWDGVHGGWPMVIVQHLNRTLPERYIAEPRIHLGSEAEIDVGAFERLTDRGENVPAVSTAWAPAAPTLAVGTELADTDEYEVRVYDAKHGRRLVAAVEIISPANKDRPQSRAQFVAKCAALLRRQVAVVLVDIVTDHDFNLYAELLEWVGERDASVGADPPPIYAVACRSRLHGSGRWLDAWNHTLEIGLRLPELPLWLSEELAIPLDLEVSYEQTCRDLRIPPT